MSDLPRMFGEWQVGRGFSPHTVRRRSAALRSFVAFIHPLPILDATGINVDDWLGTLQAARSRHAYRSDLLCFYKWAIRRQLTSTNPVLQTDAVRLPKLLPRPVEPGLIPYLIALASDDRLQLIIALAAYAGMRRSEIANLTTGDISLLSRPPMLEVRDGKGGRDRRVPIHPVLAEMLGRRRPSGLVIGLGAKRVGDLAAAHLRAHGIDATLHQLRHTFGTELARAARGNVVMVRDLMGHSAVSTTMGYIGWDGGESATVVAGMYAAGAA